jgi:hypothetical protein
MVAVASDAIHVMHRELHSRGIFYQRMEPICGCLFLSACLLASRTQPLTGKLGCARGRFVAPRNVHVFIVDS